jgi:hypothetical protein
VDYPLFFKFTHEIRSRSFGARVISQGRALMVFEDGEWWCHGVEPGGMTEHGRGPGVAFAAFKAVFGQVLQDMARESASFDSFESAARSFVVDTDTEEATRWESARQAIRSGHPVDWFFDKIRRETAERQPDVTVEKLEQLAAGEEDLALAQTG